jgi:hypothetical protein
MRRLLTLCGALAMAGVIVLLAGRGSAPTSAAAQATVEPPVGVDSFEPVLGMPVAKMVVLGSSAQPEHRQTWAYGALGPVPATIDGASYANQVVLLEHTEGSAGWQMVPLTGPGGQPLSTGQSLPYGLDALGGRVTPAGGVVVLTGGGIVTIDPGGKPRLIPEPGSSESGGEPPRSELLGKGESLPPSGSSGGAGTAYAALDEPGGRTGLLIAPYGDGEGGSGPTEHPGVLHYDGTGWTREPIHWEGTTQEAFTPQALACGPVSAEQGTPPSCWLLASYHSVGAGSESPRLALFRRVAAEGGTYGWEEVKVADWLLGGSVPPAGVSAVSGLQTLGATAQTLTVTAQGVWVDFEAKLNSSPAATDFSELVTPSEGKAAEATSAGLWCFGASAPGCEQTLEYPLPTHYTSFATAGGSSAGGGGAGGDPGTRIITGLPAGGLFELYAGSFHYEAGAGGSNGGVGGAAFPPAGQSLRGGGWLGQSDTYTQDNQGAAPLLHLTPSPQGDQLQEQPLPLRHPLLAVAQAPGSTPGEPDAAEIAVGLGGEVGHYTPGDGWSSESLYNSSGEAQRPTLRGVAWPEPNLAYAVGDNGAMWVWRAETGLWKEDPAAPYNFVGNLNAIAFDPGRPQIGYAVGKQGVLLSYGKTWQPISASERMRLEAELKVEEQQLNFTSIAFAGGQALASYRVVLGGSVETGGLLINEEAGGGWRVDRAAASLLAQLPEVGDTVLSKVAGLPDGGAVAAGPGLVIERESDADEWRFSPQPLSEAQNISALAAYRETGGPVRAVVSIDLDQHLNPNFEGLSVNAFRCDLPPPGGAGQPPPHLCPDPLPATGYLLRETAAGWEDMEHMTFGETISAEPKDEPLRPDPVLALLLAPNGDDGLAVGGQTGDLNGSGPDQDFETAGAMRFGSGVQSAGMDTPAPVLTATGSATFAVGGDASCANPCASFAGEHLAPDVLLSDALQSANQIASESPGGLRGFIYTGGRERTPLSSLPPEAAARELGRYSALLGSGGGSLPVYATAAPGDLFPGGAGIEPFATALAQFLPNRVPGSAYYSFTCPGEPDCPAKTSGGSVKVIVLDYSGDQLGEAQREWLEKQLQEASTARMPSIVVGNASLGFSLPDRIGVDPGPPQAQDATAVLGILCKGEASAYLFDYPGANVQTQASCGAHQLAEIGTGTLGYTSPPSAFQTDSLGSSGFLLVEVDTAAREPHAADVAPVHALVEPDVGQLALDATDGTLLRRSQVGLFEALARIPPSGTAAVLTHATGVQVLGPEPYQPIPFDCLGSNCADQVPTDFSFSSSKPDVGGFVLHEASSANSRQVQLGANQKPIADEARDSKGELTASGRFAENAKGEAINEKGEVVPREQSGLFCAYNEGTTVVSITTGGLTYSMPVTVQGGSTQYPCGTVPLKNPPVASAPVATAIPTVKPEAPQAAPPFVPPIHIAVPQAPKPSRPKPPSATVYPLVPPLAGLVQLRPAILPPPPPVGRPSPPSGTSSAQVYQSAFAPQNEREEETATDLVHNFAVYDPSSFSVRQVLYGLPLLILLLAFAGARVDRLLRPDRPRLARQTVRRQ